MPDKGSIDVLMQVIVTAQGLAMGAEDYTDVTALVQNDPMLKDFKPGHFCTLQQFDFSAGLASLVGNKGDDTDQETETSDAESVKTVAEMARATQRDRYLQRKNDDIVDMQPVSYTRILDAASTELFDALTKSKTIAKISIVKRKAAGAAASGLGYLRLNFENVLMTSLTWSDGVHVLTESGTFIYRKVTIEYKKQNPGGALVDGSTGTWTMSPNKAGQ
ncbi:MAG: hypothetical protein EOO77_36590 [Oxalobacteraceae bacterium]|nr:MAG: hypothetical protein EOO77_36590 [Oxalobacteraceae bacterium]